MGTRSSGERRNGLEFRRGTSLKYINTNKEDGGEGYLPNPPPPHTPPPTNIMKKVDFLRATRHFKRDLLSMWERNGG